MHTQDNCTNERCTHGKCGVLGWICLILLVVGGLNWGTIGFFHYNFVSALFHTWPWLERLIYMLVGLGALGAIITCIRCCHRCKSTCHAGDRRDIGRGPGGPGVGPTP